MVSGYSTSTNLPQVDGLSTDPQDLGRHIINIQDIFKHLKSKDTCTIARMRQSSTFKYDCLTVGLLCTYNIQDNPYDCLIVGL